jgi:hypothetical protein
MLKTTLISLVLFSLPAMADSIEFQISSNWTGIGGISVYGVDSLDYSNTVPLSSMGANVSMGGSNGEYTITGSFFASQGYGTASGSPGTDVLLPLFLDLPTDSGNWLYTVNDQLNDSDHAGVTYPDCQMVVLGETQPPVGQLLPGCDALMTSSQFNHSPGTPLSVGFLFEGDLDNYGESFQHQFSVTLSEIGGSEPPVTTPTPQPPSFALLGLPLVGFALLRRHLALPRRANTSA